MNERWSFRSDETHMICGEGGGEGGGGDGGAGINKMQLAPDEAAAALRPA